MTQATLEKTPFINSNLFSAYYLSERLRDRSEWDCDEEAREVLNDLTKLYELEKDLLPSYNEDALIDNWIDEVLDILGYGTTVETTLPEGDGYVDELLFDSTESRREAAAVYLDTNDTTDLFEGGIGLVEAKQWDADFSERFSENRPYYNASQQVRRYLDKTPKNIEWGILTNGRKWRLYGTKDHEAQIYYEVDLAELIENGDVDRFKYFYLFFRPNAFLKTTGSTFLDSVWSESETATQELGDDLQDNVFRALRVLGHGIVETNDLDIDPSDDEALDELKEQSLVLLYRLMFVLYAESRQLIDPEGKEAQKEYKQNFSLDQHRLNIHETIGEIDTGFEDEYSTYSTSIWNDLQDLFRLVDEGKESLGIPPYNGGLFDHDEHAFLSEHKVSDRHLAEVIYRLSTTENNEGRYVLADYGDLDTRHLGSVYEGLLEHQFQIASEDYAAVAEDGGEVWKPASEVTDADVIETVDGGSLYVTNDEGERKATGAYYTPDYVVTYIVEDTIAPLVDDIRDDLVDQGFETGTQEYLGAFLRRVTQLKILDPAMGSGHFLTAATGYLAERVMKEVREVEVELGVAFNEQHVRREIAKECIYGVDINGMAVELAKLSMWLETLAADRPLAFLDHHLKDGNSLVGSDITEVLSEDNGDTDGQLTLTQSFALARQQTLSHVMDLMSDLLAIDNERLEDIKSMEDLYDEIRGDPLYQRLFEVANVHTAEQFGVDVPGGVYEDMAMAIDDDKEWTEIREKNWFKSAQTLAEKESIFHWELEYPEVFFGKDGEKLNEAGFDAVIGNPPYVFISSIPEAHREYYKKTSDTWDYRFDLYGLFTELGHTILKESGTFGYIIPHSLLNNNSFEDLRKFLISHTSSIEVYDFTAPVFEDAANETMVLISKKSNDSQTQLRGTLIQPSQLLTAKQTLREYSANAIERLPGNPFLVRGGDWVEQMLSDDGTERLDNHVDAVQGLRTGNNTERLSDSKETDKHRKALGGENISRYSYSWSGTYVLYDRELLSADQAARQREEKYWEAGEKILVQEIRNVHLKRRIVATIDTEKHIGLNTTNAIIKLEGTSLNLHYILAIISSTLVNDFFRACFVDNHIATQYIDCIPIPIPDQIHSHHPERIVEISKTLQEQDAIELEQPAEEVEKAHHIHDVLETLSQLQTDNAERKTKLNLEITDHLGSYSEGLTLADIGLAQPPSGSGDSIVQQTAGEKPNLRVGEANVVRESANTVEIRLTARYKPGEQDGLDESKFETDQWGYTETDPQPALRITDLSEKETSLIEAFVPIAVEKAGGFADFRESATKTNSLVDRLRKLTLPDLSDVEAGLNSYIQTKERAERLDGEIERTDELIDEIVYKLYGLTDNEIEI